MEKASAVLCDRSFLTTSFRNALERAVLEVLRQGSGPSRRLDLLNVRTSSTLDTCLPSITIWSIDVDQTGDIHVALWVSRC